MMKILEILLFKLMCKRWYAKLWVAEEEDNGDTLTTLKDFPTLIRHAPLSYSWFTYMFGKVQCKWNFS